MKNLLRKPSKSTGFSFDEHHAAFAEFHEGYVSRHIQLADTKASFVFGGVSALIAYLFSKPEVKTVLFAPTWTGAWPFLLAAVMLLAGSAASAFSVIAPRLKSSGEGIVYFGAVSTRSTAADYEREIGAKTESELVSARLRHCYDVSRICSRKYTYLRRAMWMAFPGVVLAIIISLAIRS